MLGDQNPVASWANQNHGMLSQWGAGLAQGPTFSEGLANAARLGPAGQLIDEQHAKDAAEKAARENKIKQSAADLAKWPDLVKYVSDTGDTAGAFGEAFKRSAPGYGVQEPIKVGKGDTLLNPKTYEPLYTPPADAPEVQPGMMAGPDGTQVPVPGGKEAFDRADSIWKEYQAAEPVKSYQLVRNGYERLRSAATQTNGAGDVSMIFAYMKMLDPTSVVREGEFATAEQTGGIPTQISNLYNKLLNGERLTPEQRQQFIAAGDGLYQETVQNLTAANDQYSGRAKQWGVDPSTITMQPETYQPLGPKVAPDYKTKYGLR